MLSVVYFDVNCPTGCQKLRFIWQTLSLDWWLWWYRCNLGSRWILLPSLEYDMILCLLPVDRIILEMGICLLVGLLLIKSIIQNLVVICYLEWLQIWRLPLWIYLIQIQWVSAVGTADTALHVWIKFLKLLKILYSQVLLGWVNVALSVVLLLKCSFIR